MEVYDLLPSRLNRVVQERFLLFPFLAKADFFPRMFLYVALGRLSS